MDTSLATLITDVAALAAARMRVSPARREDLRQDGALAALEALPRFKPERGDIRGFLYSAALNRIRRVLERDNLAGAHRVDTHTEFSDVPAVPDFEGEPLTQIISLDDARRRTEQLRALREALHELPADDARLLRRIYVDGARHHELASEASCSRQAITKRHHRALTRARAAMCVPVAASE